MSLLRHDRLLNQQWKIGIATTIAAYGQLCGVCRCFYCVAIFQRLIDSVIGSASGYPITEPFLTEMRCRWFNTP